MIYYLTWKQLPDHPGKHTMLHWSPPSYRWQEVVFCIIQPFTMSKNNKNKNEPLCKKVNANRTVSMLAGTPLLEDGTMVCVNVLSAHQSNDPRVWQMSWTCNPDRKLNAPSVLSTSSLSLCSFTRTFPIQSCFGLKGRSPKGLQRFGFGKCWL